MGYVGKIGSSRSVSPNGVEKGVKPAPRVPVNLPPPVKVPPPPNQSNSPKQ
jgi:hypothetical protein